MKTKSFLMGLMLTTAGLAVTDGVLAQSRPVGGGSTNGNKKPVCVDGRHEFTIDISSPLTMSDIYLPQGAMFEVIDQKHDMQMIYGKTAGNINPMSGKNFGLGLYNIDARYPHAQTLLMLVTKDMRIVEQEGISHYYRKGKFEVTGADSYMAGRPNDNDLVNNEGMHTIGVNVTCPTKGPK